MNPLPTRRDSSGLRVYRLLLVILSPLIDLYLFLRRLKGKEDKKRYKERRGFPSKARPDGVLLWFHAASVGESVSILQLITSLLDAYPKLHILVTTGTVTSSSLLEPKLPARALHQYVPIDKLAPVRRFLAHWTPDIACFVESEIWPNLLVETAHTGAAMLQINGRLSAESLSQWQRLPDSARALFGQFHLSLAQTEEDAGRLRNLGAPNVKCFGNLKLDAAPLPAEPVAFAALVKAVGMRPVLVAASTHPGEETQILDAHKALCDAIPDLLTILIPRHPQRGEDIQKELAPLLGGTLIPRRSLGALPDAKTRLYLADTLGELGLFYRIADCVFMGGSLVSHGGQNPLEPIRLNAPVITGPYTHNFQELYHTLEKAHGIKRVKDVAGLVKAATQLMTKQKDADALRHHAALALQHGTKVLHEYTAQISAYIDAAYAGENGR